MPDVDFTKLPAHIAIIMDGNRRWARKNGKLEHKGHYAGAESVRDIVECCAEIGIKVLTLYAFSTENWTRKKVEVDTLMSLLCEYLKKERVRLVKNNIVLRVSGDISRIPGSTKQEIENTIRETGENTGLIFNLALNYGSRQEIVQALQKIIDTGTKVVDEKMISSHLYTAGLPDPDLLIRTSNELRVSNFMLWQLAYTELYFTPVLWPEFKRKDLLTALAEFQKRGRRYGE
ncbi:MAG: isoprenyl transferase [Elusimicrobiota bacterium]